MDFAGFQWILTDSEGFTQAPTDNTLEVFLNNSVSVSLLGKVVEVKSVCLLPLTYKRSLSEATSFVG